MRARLDQAMAARRLVGSRSQAESFIKLGEVKVNGLVVKKPGRVVGPSDKIELTAKELYVSRAALKLASVASQLGLNFENQNVLDVGSSTGGYTDYALKNGAKKVIAVELGTDQLHPSLRNHPRVELYEQTDILKIERLPAPTDLALIDVSFISLRKILPHVAGLVHAKTQIVAMVKPQFEARASSLKHKGVIKNDRMRREILRDFEAWARHSFLIENKADSEVAGAKGNLERFYLLRKL